MDRCTWSVCVQAVGNLRFWDDDGAAVFYSVSSGDTHLVDALAVELYELLLTRPQSELQLLHALHDVIEPGSMADAGMHLHDHLTQLQSIGLLYEQGN